jgi:hypothetical protein
LIEILAEYYQKTYELTYELWKQRNRTFLLLLALIGGATLLTFKVPEANSLLVDLIAKILDIKGDQRIKELRNSFPFGLLQSILLVAIFYLMVNLYHRATYVLRNYSYLGALEAEIRQHLHMPPHSVMFTRESTFYWHGRSPLLGAVKWIYIAFLGSLLLAFLLGRIVDDFRSGNVILAAIDIVIAIPTAMFFVAYAVSSVSMDTERAIVPQVAGGLSSGATDPACRIHAERPHGTG